jgi:hypothetical protein
VVSMCTTEPAATQKMCQLCAVCFLQKRRPEHRPEHCCSFYCAGLYQHSAAAVHTITPNSRCSCDALSICVCCCLQYNGIANFVFIVLSITLPLGISSARCQACACCRRSATACAYRPVASGAVSALHAEWQLQCCTPSYITQRDGCFDRERPATPKHYTLCSFCLALGVSAWRVPVLPPLMWHWLFSGGCSCSAMPAAMPAAPCMLLYLASTYV